MAIWTTLIKEYFEVCAEGDAIEILDWIKKNKEREIKEYIQCQRERLPFKTYDRYNVARFEQLIKLETISRVLNYMFRRNKLYRRPALSYVAWIYSPCI